MKELLIGLEYLRISNNFLEEYIKNLDKVLNKFKSAGFKVNAEKSFFTRNELEYLGFKITGEGIMPSPNKVEAIKKIAFPTTKKQLQSFIGLINYYRDMREHSSGILTPSSSMTSKRAKWNWSKECQKVFDTIKKLVSTEPLFSYPNFNVPSVIHTDASKLQLGAVISQDDKPIAFLSRKLNSAQFNSTTTECKLLSIVGTLKDYRNIPLGQPDGFKISLTTKS